jgi:hypothetical protein
MALGSPRKVSGTNYVVAAEALGSAVLVLKISNYLDETWVVCVVVEYHFILVAVAQVDLRKDLIDVSEELALARQYLVLVFPALMR